METIFLNPQGHPKTISKEVERKLTDGEIKSLKKYRVNKDHILAIFETEDSNFNLMVSTEGIYYSVPKDEPKAKGCQISIFGDFEHTMKYHFIIH